LDIHAVSGIVKVFRENQTVAQEANVSPANVSTAQDKVIQIFSIRIQNSRRGSS
jgi:hypothetical protein